MSPPTPSIDKACKAAGQVSRPTQDIWSWSLVSTIVCHSTEASTIQMVTSSDQVMGNCSPIHSPSAGTSTSSDCSSTSTMFGICTQPRWPPSTLPSVAVQYLTRNPDCCTHHLWAKLFPYSLFKIPPFTPTLHCYI